MDFFSAAADPATQPVSIENDIEQDVVADVPDTFAQAIANRFGSAAMLTARLTPTTAFPTAIRSPDTPMSKMTITPRLPMPPPLPPVALFFPAIPPLDIEPWIADLSALIVDIRPHAAHASARVPRAVSLSVPSTLLKRPLFSLERLSGMLPSSKARKAFGAWRTATRILVYDADSQGVGDSSNIYGLLRKFKADGFDGELAWLRGGFQAVWKERRDLVDTHPPTPETENEEEEEDSNDKPVQPSILRTRHLPMAAFSLSSTTVHNSPHFNTSAAPAPKRQAPPSILGTSRPSSNSATANSHPAFNPFFDTIRQNTELSHGITERIALRLPRRVRRRIQDLPFRWLQDIAKRAETAPPVHTSNPLSDSSSSESEGPDDDANSAEVEEGKEALAMQFFKIELAEQRRLMGIMEHHSKESGQMGNGTSLVPFPFSITAGVEKGAKNRYRHIWPFEHARVRLHQKKDVDDDYVNASYVQPLGTNKKYIATQGPLPATFTDFWTLCWEQNVHVIVMLTREVEGAMVKCGAYWSDTEFGPLRLRLVSTEGLAPPEERVASTAHPGGFFASPKPQPRRFPQSAGSDRRYRNNHYRTNRSETVKRTFELSHTGYPAAPPRKIVHLQYLEWPDMNVPDDPRGILGLIKQVDDAVRETQSESSEQTKKKPLSPGAMTKVDEKTGVAKHAMDTISPVLLHCSAGVGRTGGFIAVDAVLDAIRREIRSGLRPATTVNIPVQHDAMDVDSAEPVNVPTAPLTMSSGGTESGPGGEHVVHVPLAPPVPMQVDESETPNTDTSDSDKDVPPEQQHKFGTSGTMRWAEDVGVETGIHGNSPGGPHAHKLKLHRSNTATRSTAFGSATDATSNFHNNDSKPSSLAGFSSGHHGSYHHHYSSSSVGTSVSGSSSYASSKANQHNTGTGNTSTSGGFFPSSTPRTTTSTQDLLQVVLNQQASAERARMRTISAPAPQQPFATAPQPQPPMTSSLSGSSSVPWSAGENSSTDNNEDDDDKMVVVVEDTAAAAATSEEVAKSSAVVPNPTLPSVPNAHHGVYGGRRSPSKRDRLAGGMSSEGEAPSSSQSPSPDEEGEARVVIGGGGGFNGSGSGGGRGGGSSRGPPPGSLKLRLSQAFSLSMPPKLPMPTPPTTTTRDSSPPDPLLPLPHASSSLSRPAAAAVVAGGVPANDTDDHTAKTFDYKEPRALHEVYTPPALSTFDDPIWEVVQDMREQRMSLCQSLRQYVFVHAAVVEGALWVLDEEREIEMGLGLVPAGPRGGVGGGGGYGGGMGSGSDSGNGTPEEKAGAGAGAGANAGTGKFQFPGNNSAPAGGSTAAADASSNPTSPSRRRSPTRNSFSSHNHHRHAPYPTLHLHTTSNDSISSSALSKRGASPTELVKEEYHRGVGSAKSSERDIDTMMLHLSKRPSIKRKQRSGDDQAHAAEEARYHPVPNRVASTVLMQGGVSAPSSRSMPP